MKKLITLLIWISAITCGFSQGIGTSPASLGDAGTTVISLFKESPFPMTLIWDSGADIPTPVKAYLFSNEVKVDSTTVTVVADTIKFTFTKTQIKSLGKKPQVQMTFGGEYMAGADLLISTKVGIPNTTAKRITIGNGTTFRVYVAGDAASAISAANRATNQAAIAIAARDSARTLLTSSGAELSKRLRHGTMAQLRATTESISGFEVVEGRRSGTFILDPLDTTSTDDSSMVVIRSGGYRFKREVKILTPEKFGAVADGVTDCGDAINKMFRYAARMKGAVIEFGIGTYLTSKTLKILPGTGAPYFTYNISIRGAGVGATTIKGTDTFTGNLMQADSGVFAFNQRETWLFINDLKLIAGGADRCFYGNYLAGLRVTDIYMVGGELECMKLGSEVLDGVQNTLNYSVYLTRVGYNAGTKEIPGVRHSGSSNGGIIANSLMFLYIEAIEGDNGRYGIYMKNCVDATIFGGKIEGTKKATIWIDGNAGTHNHKIWGNYLSNYAGFDGNGVFDGTMVGMMIKGVYPFGITVSNNHFLLAQSADLPNNFLITSPSAVIEYGACCYIATGGTSAASGNIIFVNSARDRVQIKTNSGTFQVGEVVTVRNSLSAVVGTFTIGTIVPNETYGIKLEGASGGNSITGNMFSSQTDYGIHSTQSNNHIVNNAISGKVGVYVTSNGSVANNNIYSPGGVAIQNVNGLADAHSNTNTGTLAGVVEKNYFTGNMAVSTGSTFRAYRTTDQTTNTAYGSVGWESNNLVLRSNVTGTEPAGSVLLGTQASIFGINPSTDTRGYFDAGTTSTGVNTFQFRGIYTGTTSPNITGLTPTINKTGGLYRALFVSPYEQSVSGTTRELFNFGTNSAANASGTHTTQFKGTMSGSTLILSVPNMPTYADNAAAITGGLGAGDVYKTSTGELRIRY